MRSKVQCIGAVEIGSSKISVLAGVYSGGQMAIVGRAQCQSRGVIKGTVVDFKAVSDCVHSALEQAEHDAGARLDEVFLAQTGGHLEGFYNEAVVNVKAADNMVSADDIVTVCDLARNKELPAGRSVVRHIQRPFRLDGRAVPTSPEHLVGRRLEVGYWVVHGTESKLADNIHVIRGFNLEVSELVLSSLASGHVITTPEDRQNGVLAIDIGAGTTDFVLYRDGVPFVTGVVPVGGEHFTNDLGIGLRLNGSQAESIKLRYGRAEVQAKDKADKVWLNGNYAVGDRQFTRSAIEQITAARAWETLENVRKRLGGAFTPETCPAGVVLTGGTAKLAEIAAVAAKVFNVPAELGEAPKYVNEDLRDPGWHTAIGVLHYGMEEQSKRFAARRRPGLWGGLGRFFVNS